ncbi:hypothetical protein [Clostridium sp. OS1-26]|uniref:hypothetical protein n=1 Tax=Clostridium sp. OS1-26 TaxID=3070681 RepID=UPI0027E0DCE7|nr:hypothetical protein [Clostridium sp. OS1-26]WML34303.1 hypothetical protein RCG18_23890 [Clostridium sp. OS1-26]
MSSYKNSYLSYGLKNKKKHGKAFKIFFFTIFCLVILAGILLVTNYKTIWLATGKGDIRVNTISQAEKSLSDTGKFNSATVTSSADQTQVLTSTSKDNAVVLTVTQQKNGKEMIDAKVDLKKLDFQGIDKEALLHGSPSAIMAAKALANDYIGTLIDSNDETGIETYLAANLLSQYKSNPTSLNIDHTFDNAHLTLTGNLSIGKIDVSITK